MFGLPYPPPLFRRRKKKQPLPSRSQAEDAFESEVEFRATVRQLRRRPSRVLQDHYATLGPQFTEELKRKRARVPEYDRAARRDVLNGGRPLMATMAMRARPGRVARVPRRQGTSTEAPSATAGGRSGHKGAGGGAEPATETPRAVVALPRRVRRVGKQRAAVQRFSEGRMLREADTAFVQHVRVGPRFPHSTVAFGGRCDEPGSPSGAQAAACDSTGGRRPSASRTDGADAKPWEVAPVLKGSGTVLLPTGEAAPRLRGPPSAQGPRPPRRWVRRLSAVGAHHVERVRRKSRAVIPVALSRLPRSRRRDEEGGKEAATAPTAEAGASPAPPARRRDSLSTPLAAQEPERVRPIRGGEQVRARAYPIPEEEEEGRRALTQGGAVEGARRGPPAPQDDVDPAAAEETPVGGNAPFAADGADTRVLASPRSEDEAKAVNTRARGHPLEAVLGTPPPQSGAGTGGRKRRRRRRRQGKQAHGTGATSAGVGVGVDEGGRSRGEDDPTRVPPSQRYSVRGDSQLRFLVTLGLDAPFRRRQRHQRRHRRQPSRGDGAADGTPASEESGDTAVAARADSTAPAQSYSRPSAGPSTAAAAGEPAGSPGAGPTGFEPWMRELLPLTKREAARRQQRHVRIGRRDAERAGHLPRRGEEEEEEEGGDAPSVPRAPRTDLGMERPEHMPYPALSERVGLALRPSRATHVFSRDPLFRDFSAQYARDTVLALREHGAKAAWGPFADGARPGSEAVASALLLQDRGYSGRRPEDETYRMSREERLWRAAYAKQKREERKAAAARELERIAAFRRRWGRVLEAWYKVNGARPSNEEEKKLRAIAEGEEKEEEEEDEKKEEEEEEGGGAGEEGPGGEAEAKAHGGSRSGAAPPVAAATTAAGDGRAGAEDVGKGLRSLGRPRLRTRLQQQVARSELDYKFPLAKSVMKEARRQQREQEDKEARQQKDELQRRLDRVALGASWLGRSMDTLGEKEERAAATAMGVVPGFQQSAMAAQSMSKSQARRMLRGGIVRRMCGCGAKPSKEAATAALAVEYSLDDRCTELLKQVRVKQEDVRAMFRRFEALDRDEVGTITVDDFFKRQDLSHCDMGRRLLGRGDTRPDGSMGFNEYLRVVLRVCPRTKQQMVRLCFDHFAASAEEGMTQEEFARALEVLSEGKPVFGDPPEAVFSQVDASKTGFVDASEFQGLYRTHPLLFNPFLRFQTQLFASTLGESEWGRVQRDTLRWQREQARTQLNSMQGKEGQVSHAEAARIQEQLRAAEEEAKQQERVVTGQQGPPKRSLGFRLSERLFVALRCLPPPKVPKPGEGLGDFGDEAEDVERRAQALELVNRGWLTVTGLEATPLARQIQADSVAMQVRLLRSEFASYDKAMKAKREADREAERLRKQQRRERRRKVLRQIEKIRKKKEAERAKRNTEEESPSEESDVPSLPSSLLSTESESETESSDESATS